MKTNLSLSFWAWEEKGRGSLCVKNVSWETFSRVSNVAHEMDKDEGASDKLSIQIQTCFEFEWLTN